MNNNFRRNQIVDEPARELGNDSMHANEFNIKMNKSITDSVQNKSENNLQFNSPEDGGEGSASADRRAITTELNNNNGFRDPLVPNGEMPLRGSGSMEGTSLMQLPINH